MEKFIGAVSQLSTSINQIKIAISQIQATIGRMEIRLNNLENDHRGSNYRCAGQEIDKGSY